MKSLFTIALIAFISVGSTYGQDVTVDEIVDTYYEAIGGKEAWRKVKTMKITGEGVQMGMKFPVTVLAKEPNLTKVDVDIQGMKITEAYDLSLIHI